MSKIWLVTRRATKIETWQLIVTANSKEEAEGLMSVSDCEWCNAHGYIEPNDTDTIMEEIIAVEATAEDCEEHDELVDERGGF